METLDTLLDRAQDGDVSAYGEIVRRFQAMALGYAYATLGDMHLAEDAVQDAFIETYINLSRVYGPRAFPAFLRKVIYKHCDRATRGRRPEVELDDTSPLASRDTPELDLERNETIQRVHRAYVSLPLPERQAVVLFYINHRKRQEIASFLDLPLETVIYRLRNAREILRKELNAMNPDRLEQIIAEPAEKAGPIALSEIEADEVRPDLALYVGKLRDYSSMGVNLLHHSLDVAHLAGIIAAELGLDVRLAQRAGLLHDIGKSAPDGRSHVERGLELGSQHDEHPVIRDVIATHHDPNEGLSPYAFTVKAADVLATTETPPTLETSAPQVINLNTIAESQTGDQAIHAVRVGDEMWVLVQGGGQINADRLRSVLTEDIPIRITQASVS